MVKQYCIPIGSSSEWKDALDGMGHTFGHTWENCYAMHLTTGQATFLYCYESEKGRVVCPIAERQYDGFTDILKPFGFSGFVSEGECPDFAAHWKEFAAARGYVCGYLGLSPIQDLSHCFDSYEIFQYDKVHLIDLSLTHEELKSNLARNRRQQLQAWGDEVFSSLLFEKPALVEFFLDTYVDFFQGKNAAESYFFSKETLDFLFKLDNVIIVGAGRSGRVEAVAVFTCTRDVGEYLFNLSAPEGREYAFPLAWYGITHLKSLGLKVFNFGGGSGGVGEMKRRYGGKEVPLKCLKQIYRPDVYGMLCRSAGSDPDVLTGYFPPYRSNCFEPTDVSVQSGRQ